LSFSEIWKIKIDLFHYKFKKRHEWKQIEYTIHKHVWQKNVDYHVHEVKII